MSKDAVLKDARLKKKKFKKVFNNQIYSLNDDSFTQCVYKTHVCV